MIMVVFIVFYGENSTNLIDFVGFYEIHIVTLIVIFDLYYKLQKCRIQFVTFSFYGSHIWEI